MGKFPRVKKRELTPEEKEAVIERLDKMRISLSSDVPSQSTIDASRFLLALPEDVKEEVKVDVEGYLEKIKEKDIPESIQKHEIWDEEDKRYTAALQMVLDKKVSRWNKDFGVVYKYK